MQIRTPMMSSPHRGGTRFGSRGLPLALAAALAALAFACGPARAADVSDDYRIGAGDVLRIDVIGRQDVSNTYTVSSEGTVTLPVVGTVAAAGKTPNELASDLSRRFSLFGRDIPQVRVTVTDYKRRSVYVLGAVLLPGVYSFPRNPNVWDAINEAGGTTEDAKLSAVELIRARSGPGVPAEVIDVEAAIREGRLEALPRLGPGDTVRVPRGRGGVAGESVYIFGAIAKPGALGLDAAPDLVSAVIRSGGPAPDADLERVEIVRK